VIEIKRNDIETECSVCGRSLLLGEHLVTYHRHATDDAYVCTLCLDAADARGWIREGSPSVPLQMWTARPRGIKGLFAGRKQRNANAGPTPFEPEALPDDPHDAVEASIELFNESGHRRTVSGIIRTLGEPQVSVLQRSHREVVVTIAWELSWYQFRIDMLGAQPVVLQHRGAELDEIDEKFRAWNAVAEADGTVAMAA
jgi:hypothetical protein